MGSPATGCSKTRNYYEQLIASGGASPPVFLRNENAGHDKADDSGLPTDSRSSG